jgi:RES domain-containing protein
VTLWREWHASNPGSTARERRRLWQLQATDLPVIDLRDPAVVQAVGVDPTSLVGPRDQARPLADRARELGADGMVVPSAAHPGGWNVVVFPTGFDRLRVVRERDLRPPA